MATSMPVSRTLRTVIGLDDTPPNLADTTLIMVDFQNTYLSGVMELDNADAAVKAAARLLNAARTAGAKVVHIVNDGGEGTPYDIRAEIGAIIPELAPIEGEPVVVKRFPNSFHDTVLDKTLRDLDAGPEVVIAGFMTHMCVAFTAQGAFHLGYRPTVVADATATRPLAAPDGAPQPAETLQAAALTTIGDLFGVVVPNAEALVRS